MASDDQEHTELQTLPSSPHIKTVDDLRITLLIKAVVADTLKEHNLSEEEMHWVRLAIKREGRIEQFRSAIIEKTLTGVVWASIVVICYAVWEYLKLKLGTKT